MLGQDQVHGKESLSGKVQGQLKIRMRPGHNEFEGHFKARKYCGQCEVQEDLQDHKEVRG